MKKNVINSDNLKFFLINFFIRKKNSLKRLSIKTIPKIGLFLVFIFSFYLLGINMARASFFSDRLNDAFFSTAAVALPGGASIKGAYTTLSALGIGADTATDGVALAFNWLLYGVLLAISKLLSLAGLLLDFCLATSSDYLGQLVKAEEVYKLWALVRDILNMFFMLLLLFSAFATIFQVEKYHLRKIIIMLVVMALLVNFSYPISLFVIDFSNSAMYFIIDAAFGANTPSKSAGLNDVVSFGKSLEAYYGKASFFDSGMTAQLICSIVLVFIYFITICALAINLLVRMAAFIVLVILSPFGFVFAFFPGTTSLSNAWWGKLLNYAFMGPVLAFFLLMVTVLFRGGTVLSSSSVVGMDDMVNVPIHIIGIIFLWLGLSFSNKLGGDASNVAMGFAKKTGNNIKSYGQKAAWGGVVAGANYTGVPGAIKSRWSQFKDAGKSAADRRAAIIGDKIGVKGAKEKDMKRRAEEYKKNLAQTDELKRLAVAGDAAAAYRLAEDKDMDQKTYDAFMSNNKEESLRKAINSKTKQTRVDLVAINNAKNISSKMTSAELASKKAEIVLKNPAATNWNDDAVRRHVEQEEINNEIGKLTAEKWSEQDWSEMSKNLSLADRGRVSIAAKKSFSKFKQPAIAELQKRLNPNNAGALNAKFGVVV